MSKMVNLKEWLTVAETAQHLSATFQEDISEADVLRLALDGHLQLSVNFVNPVMARETKTPIPGIVLPDGKNDYISGIWNLTMEFDERRDIEKRFWELTGGPLVEFYIPFDGVIVQRFGLKGDLRYQIQEPFDTSDDSDFRAADRLPSDAVLIVTTDAIRNFEQSKNKSQSRSEATCDEHESSDLKIVRQAARRFWANADRNDKTTHPTNAQVEAWLVRNELSQRLAKASATIIRPDWAETGRKPDEQ
jgi:hypothetical protein